VLLAVVVEQVTLTQDQMVVVELLETLVVLVVDQQKVEVLLGHLVQMVLLDKVLVVSIHQMEHQVVEVVEEPVDYFLTQKQHWVTELLAFKCLPGLVL
jgi:hypothetical protein